MGNPNTRQYDPANVILNIGGRDISGFAEGTFIEVDRYADAFSMSVGSDGEVTRVKNQNVSGYFKCTLQQSSPSNDYLSSLATQDEQSSNAVVPVLLTDKNGTTLAKGAKSWVKKKAKPTYANTAESREWSLDTGNLQLDVGGENEA
jgi:hypothetical protein